MLIGVVGKPSTGKSTFFKAATLADAEIANYPFTTIKANEAVAYVKVPDVAQEFGKQSNPRNGYTKGKFRFLPVKLLDVAGLVEGAHGGKGMGNQFLDDLNKADVLLHVVDISGSTNAKGEAVDALSYDPLLDVLFLEKELDYWFLRLIKKGWDKFVRALQQEKSDLFKAVAKQLSGIGVDEDLAKEVLMQFPSELVNWTEEDLFHFAHLLREKTKPLLIAANKIDVPGSEKNFERLQEYFPSLLCIPCSAASELLLREADQHGFLSYIPGEISFEVKKELSSEQKKGLEFIQKNVLDIYGSTGVQKVLNAVVFDVLKYLAVYPGGVNKLEDSKGNVLPDCFLMKEGTTVLDFAYHLHTDFGEKFIRAIDVKTKRTVGREHLLKHQDIFEIVAGR